MEGRERVCVTGAGGYIASWVVKFLLSKDYIVHGTVRDPDNEKNAHLKKLDKAQENLKLFKADLLDYDSLSAAIVGCSGVFHVACPVPHTLGPNPEIELVEPSVKGTLNVMKGCTEARVKRVVMVSSIAAVFMNPKWPENKDMNEDCWTDIEFCKSMKGWLGWYSIAKTVAEIEAFKYSEENGISTVVICPSLVIGPLLQPTLNASTLFFLELFEERENVENPLFYYVDVRDVAEAILLLYENHGASGRYICAQYAMRKSDLAEKLKTMYPKYQYPTSFIESSMRDNRLSSEKLKSLGCNFRPLEKTLADTVENMEETGLLKQKE